MSHDIATLAARTDAFRRMHDGPGMLVMPNPWDAASARAFEAAGFPALATTSGGVAAALGYTDHEGAPADEMLAAAARIVAAVQVPVTADLEAGYGLAAADLAHRVIATGAVGLNLEDSDHHGGGVIVDAERHAERLAAFKAAARAEGADLVLNARVDVFIHRLGTPDEQLAEGLRRASLYRDAGADCVYPIGLADDAMIDAFVRAHGGPVNIMTTPRAPSLERLAALGVRRVTYATGLFRRTLATIEAMAAEIRADQPPRALR